MSLLVHVLASLHVVWASPVVVVDQVEQDQETSSCTFSLTLPVVRGTHISIGWLGERERASFQSQSVSSFFCSEQLQINNSDAALFLLCRLTDWARDYLSICPAAAAAAVWGEEGGNELMRFTRGKTKKKLLHCLSLSACLCEWEWLWPAQLPILPIGWVDSSSVVRCLWRCVPSWREWLNLGSHSLGSWVLFLFFSSFPPFLFPKGNGPYSFFSVVVQSWERESEKNVPIWTATERALEKEKNVPAL